MRERSRQSTANEQWGGKEEGPVNETERVLCHLVLPPCS
jgi:hypothetical protein